MAESQTAAHRVAVNWYNWELSQTSPVPLNPEAGRMAKVVDAHNADDGQWMETRVMSVFKKTRPKEFMILHGYLRGEMEHVAKALRMPIRTCENAIRLSMKYIELLIEDAEAAH